MNERLRQGISLWGMAAVLMLPAGCTNDNGETGTPTDGRVALQVTGGIQVDTRAHDKEWDENDAIGIYMLEKGTTTVAEDTKNRHYTTATAGETGSFAPAGELQTIYFPTSGDERDFLAYYPYRSSLADEVYKVDVSGQQNQKDIDLMAAEESVTGSKASPAVAFRFGHQLVKLRLTIKADGKALTDEALDGMTVQITNQPLTADFNVLTRQLSNIAAEKKELPLLVTNGGTACEGIVLPAVTTEGMEFVFTLTDGGIFRWDIHSAEKSKSFVAGSKYKYDIVLTGTGIEVTSTVADWNEGNGPDGESGSAE